MTGVGIVVMVVVVAVEVVVVEDYTVEVNIQVEKGDTGLKQNEVWGDRLEGEKEEKQEVEVRLKREEKEARTHRLKRNNGKVVLSYHCNNLFLFSLDSFFYFYDHLHYSQMK
jgi:hypothetical protein